MLIIERMKCWFVGHEYRNKTYMTVKFKECTKCKHRKGII